MVVASRFPRQNHQQFPHGVLLVDRDNDGDIRQRHARSWRSQLRRMRVPSAHQLCIAATMMVVLCVWLVTIAPQIRAFQLVKAIASATTANTATSTAMSTDAARLLPLLPPAPSAPIPHRPPDLPNATTTLDFIVAGFPKCGTTTLLYALRQHAGVAMDERENCQIVRPLQQDDANLKRLNADLDALVHQRRKTLSSTVVVGLKCPEALLNGRAIARLAHHSPHCRWIVGVRHPLELLASLYNYRITELYDKSWPRNHIPPFEDILRGTASWNDVSVTAVQLETHLLQLAKTNLTQSDYDKLLPLPLHAIRPNRFAVFVYTLEQMQSPQLPADVTRFLRLPTPLRSLGHENLNRFVGAQAHPESIHLCDARYATLRARFVQHHSAVTAHWMLQHFLASPEVVVSQREQFVAFVERWKHDPCVE